MVTGKGLGRGRESQRDLARSKVYLQGYIPNNKRYTSFSQDPPPEISITCFCVSSAVRTFFCVHCLCFQCLGCDATSIHLSHFSVHLSSKQGKSVANKTTRCGPGFKLQFLHLLAFLFVHLLLLYHPRDEKD